MSVNRDARRGRFFDRGVAAYRQFTGISDELYCCPICEREFDRQALERKELTLEHVPPDSLGGRDILLTCKDCQKLGSPLDAAVKERTRLWDMNEALQGREGHFRGRATLELGGHKITADVEVVKGEAKLVPWTKTNNPLTFTEAMKYYKAESQAGTLKMTVTPRVRFKARLSKVGDLKTAYLAAFAYYGYTYALHPALDPVRQQIRAPDEKLLPNWWIRPAGENEDWPTLLAVTEPFELVAIYLRTAVVVLPWPGSPVDAYASLSESVGADGHLQFNGTMREWPRRMELIMDLGEAPIPERESR